MKAMFEESDKCNKIPKVGDVWKHRNFSDIYIRIPDDQGCNALNINKTFNIDMYFFSVNIETGVICATDKKYSNNSAYNIIILKPKEPIVFIEDMKEYQNEME